MQIDVDLSPITALIIDDSRYARSFIKTGLQSFGISRVLEAGDGPSGLEVLRNSEVHLVIVDHDMSPMNGIDFTRYVRGGDLVACVDVSILMLSGDSSKDVVFQARNAGVNEFLMKPFSADSLYRRVRNAMIHPKAFVQSPSFTGPDRRSLSRSPPGVAERRIRPPLPKPPPVVAPPGGMGAAPSPSPVAKPAPVERTGRKKFAAGQVIFSEGDRGDVAYVVESGRVAIVTTVEGREVQLGQITTNGVFGEMALIDDEPRMASAKALDETVCMMIPMAALKAQIGKTPDLVILVLETLLHDIRRMGRELGQVRAALEQRRAG
ncbi:two-component system response regulator [Paramagnetospirillum kuznetsovii]|uniref:Two-component system response regulator n=1 Tax=Paramagnetospirillum kuznetsovii TaxID=2053833 RepID=A0A364NTY3_9PROT|nr:cyclic nucleotide-binding domain-containing protein [Paramagnetospirillum kuznetsovii]RAU20365.1 two-component system response regulator [Paramagnetospirillum kuznetsovii]